MARELRAHTPLREDLSLDPTIGGRLVCQRQLVGQGLACYRPSLSCQTLVVLTCLFAQSLNPRLSEDLTLYYMSPLWTLNNTLQTDNDPRKESFLAT